MRKRVQKIIGIMLVVIASCFCGLTGCKGKYDDMTLEVSTKSIELFLGEKDDGGNAINNTAEFTATVGGVGDDVSKELTQPALSTSGVVSVEKTSFDEVSGKTTFLVSANDVSTEPVVITVRTKEGGKTATVNVTVIKRITGMYPNTGAKQDLFAVVGETKNINTISVIKFEPEGTNQTDGVWTISNKNGHEATITENGDLLVTKKNGVNPLELTFTSTVAGIAPVKINVQVIQPIHTEDIKLMLDEDTEIDSFYKWQVLDLDDSDMRLKAVVNTTEDYTLSASVDGETNVVNASKETENLIDYIRLNTTGNTGTSTLTITVTLNGYNYRASKDIQIQVARLPKEIKVNGEDLTNTSKTYDIYDKYQNNLGQRFAIEIDKDATDRDYKIVLSSKYTDAQKVEYSDAVRFCYEDGAEIKLGDVIPANTNAIYAKALATKMKVLYDIIPVVSEGINDIKASLELNLAHGVSQNGIYLGTPANPLDNEKILNIELNENDEYTDFDFYINADEYSSQFDFIVSNETIIYGGIESVRFESGVNEHDYIVFKAKIKPLKEGLTSLTITSDNSVRQLVNIRIIKLVDEFTITTETPLSNANIADNGNEMYKQTEFGEKTLNRLIINNKTRDLKFNIVKFSQNDVNSYKPVNAKVAYQKVEYITGEQFTIVQAHDSEPFGYISARRVGTSKVKIIVGVYTLDGDIKDITQEFEIITFIPVERIELTRRFVELIDTTNMVNYQDYLEKEVEAIIYPRNATLTYTDSNGEEHNFSNISWAKSNSFVALDSATNANSIVIKGNEIIGTGSSRMVTVTASITQFSKVYNVSCDVVVRKAKLVNEIGNTYIGTNENNREIINPVEIGGKPIEQIYIDARNGITSKQYSLWTDVYPLDATFQDSEYIYLPSLADYNSGLYKTKPVLKFTDNIFEIKRPGVGKILVVSKDSIGTMFNENSLNSQLLTKYEACTSDEQVDALISQFCTQNSQLRFKLMYVKVADGKSEATAINIATISDLVEINSQEGLDKYYIQTEDIDVSSKSNFEPIGSFNHIGFNGNYNGNGKTIKNVRFDFKEQSKEEYSAALFEKIGDSGIVKNLNVTIQYMNISVINGNSLNVMLAGLAVTNNGTIQNSSVNFKNSKLEINTTNFYFGGLVAVNNNNIKNSKVSGNINFSRIGGEKTALGGLVGENQPSGVVEGEFNLDFNDTTISINADYDVDAVIIIEVKSAPSILNGSSYGGIAGINNGTIKQISSKAVIKSKLKNVGHINNVGGIVGLNTGNIIKALSCANIVGQDNVGGIVGTSNAGTLEQIYNLMFEENDIDDISHKDEYVKVKGEGNVGGIVGYANNTSISYAMVRSYVKRDIGESFACDIKLLTSSDNNSHYAGGIAGKVGTCTISNSFAYLTLQGDDKSIIGGLVGFIDNESQINTCYSRGIIYDTNNKGMIYGNGTNDKITNVYSNLTGNDENFVDNDLSSIEGFANIIGKNYNQNNWIVGTDENGYKDFNDNLPMIIINGKPFILQEPKSLSLSFSSDNQFAQNGKSNKISGTHKVLDEANQKALLFYYPSEDVNEVNQSNKIDIRNLFSTEIIPSNATNSVKFTSSNTSVIKVEGNQIVVMGTGSATIICTSLLNNQAKDSVDVVVVDAISQFDIYSDVEHKKNLDSLDIIKGQSKEIYFGSDSNAMVTYKISTELDTDEIKINGKTLSIENPILFASNDSIVIEGISKTQATIKFAPYFEIDGKLVEVGLYKDFELYVKNGISNISTEFNEADISQKDSFEMNVDITSDCEDSELEITNKNISSKVYAKNSQGILEEQTNLQVVQQGTTNTYDIKQGEDVVDSFELDVKLSKIENGVSVATISIDKAPVNYQVILEIEFTAKLKQSGEGNDDTISKSCKFILNVLQQPVHFVNTEFYSYAELDASGNYNVNEVPTNTILAGKIGLLKLDLYPDFAGIDRVEVEYQNFGYTVDMQQMIYKGYNENDINKSSYEMLNMATPKIPNGIVFDKTYKNILSKKVGDDKYSFDGYLYVYVLIPSLASVTDSINFRITTYCSNGDIIRTNKTLKIDLPSEVDMTFNGDYNAFIANNYEYETNLVVRTTQLMKSASDDANLSIEARIGDNGNWTTLTLNEVTSLDNNNDYVILISKNGVSSLSYNKKTYTTTFKIKISGKIGNTVQLRAGYTTLVNNQNQTYYTPKNLSVYLAKYTVNGFTLNGAKASIFEKLTGSQYRLKVNLITTYQEFANENDEDELVKKITKLEDIISSKINTWYALRRDDSLAGAPYAYLPIKTNSTSTESSLYDYFMFLYGNEIDNEDGDKIPTINIAPTRESLTEVLQAVVAVKYVNGVPQWYRQEDEISEVDKQKQNLLAEYPTNTYDYNNNIIYLRDRWTLHFIYNNTSDKPNPIATYEQFKQMANFKNYRLVNDIIIDEPLAPINAEIAGLDGNGFTIYLTQGFDLTSQKDEDTLNVGLFGTVSENTVLKNIKLSIKYLNTAKNETMPLSANTIDLSQIIEGETVTVLDATKVNFGYIAGVNNGSIYNCEVVENGKDLIDHASELTEKTGAVTIKTNILNSSNTTVETNIGGIAGQNNGALTHSRVTLKLYANRGYIGGIAGYNNGAIVNSFYKVNEEIESAIKNDATTEINNQTAGFVAINDTKGSIKLSYTEGYKLDNNKNRYTGGKVSSNANASGFVVTNKGLIENCYSNIEVVSEKRSSGFVFSNEGQVRKCYSASSMIENSTSHTVFTGTNEKNFANVTSTSVMEDCYYFADNKKIVGALNEQATAFKENNQLTGFDFGENGQNGNWNNKKSSFTVTEQEKPQYEVTENGFGWTSISVITKDVNLPTLVDANIIAVPHIAINEIENKDDDTKDKEYKWNTDFDGSMFNPIIINSASDFNDKISTIKEEVNNFSKYFRIINNITFSATEKPTTTNADFSGYICGNGFTLSGIAISANTKESTYTTNVKDGNNDYGLFATIVGDTSKIIANEKQNGKEHQGVTSEQLATVKDLIIGVEYLSANQVKCVGTLAGSLIDAKVSNIVIDGKDVVVQGMNFVGGLAGQIIGNSNVKNITSNVSINAGKYIQQDQTYVYDLTTGSSEQGTYNITNYIDNATINYSYAGAIAGVVHLIDTGKVENVLVQSGSSLIANHAGLAFGLVGENSLVSHATAIIDNEQYIRATTTAGGLVAENRGIISSSSVYYENGTNTDFYSGTPKVIGGLVGFNYNGKIIGSLSKIDAKNSSCTIAGGLVGTTVGGDISYSYSTGDVDANHVRGGLIGSYLKEDNLVMENTIMSNEKIYSISELRFIEYNLTEDTTRVEGKTYYTEENGLYSVNTTSTNPKESGLYERVDNTPKLTLNHTLSLHNFNLSNSFDPTANNKVFGSVIGAVDGESSISNYQKNTDTTIVSGKTYFIFENNTYTKVSEPSEGDLSNYYERIEQEHPTNYYIYFNVEKGYFSGSVSNTPNGTKNGDITKYNDKFFTNKITIANRVEPINFTFNQITQCSSYYKSIFDEGIWKDYFDITNLNRNNMYPEIKR